MNKIQLYSCGHPRTNENTVGIISPRCRSCRLVQTARQRELRRQGRLAIPPRYRALPQRAKLSKLIAEPAVVLDTEQTATAFEHGSRALLTALYREHPYVFDAAEQAGRQVVRP